MFHYFIPTDSFLALLLLLSSSLLPLTLSGRAWYQYQVASCASRRDGVLVLRDSHKVVK
jgi:hypothetical protein